MNSIIQDYERYADEIQNLEGKLLHLPQVHCPLAHKFAPGIYYREIFMPAGAFVIGQKHKTKHLNVIITGKVSVMIDGDVRELSAPLTFMSNPGVRKILFTHEDTRWVTIHPTDLTDLTQLEELLIEKSPAFNKHEVAQIEKFRLENVQQQEEQQQQTWVAVAVGVSFLGAAVSGVGMYASASAQASSQKYNAAVEANNAGAAAQQAKFDANQISDATRRNVANQRAAMAASGFDPNTGSFSDVTQDTKRQGELNRLSRVYQGRLGVNRAMSQSQLDSMSASNDSTAGAFGLGSSLLGGVSQATTISQNPAFKS